MSWPSDGLPRYIVYEDPPHHDITDHLVWVGMRWHVLDRANCHRVVMSMPTVHRETHARGRRRVARVVDALSRLYDPHYLPEGRDGASIAPRMGGHPSTRASAELAPDDDAQASAEGTK